MYVLYGNRRVERRKKLCGASVSLALVSAHVLLCACVHSKQASTASCGKLWCPPTAFELLLVAGRAMVGESCACLRMPALRLRALLAHCCTQETRLFLVLNPIY